MREAALRGLAAAAVVVAACFPAWGAERERYQEECLIIPEDYTPERSWPIFVVWQNMVDDEQLKGTPYFAAFGGNRGTIMAAAAKWNFDPMRIYATAFSRSGHGLLEKAWQYPHRYAAIVPVCNDLRQKKQYKRQKNVLVRYLQQTPTKLLHGKNDSFVRTGKILHEFMVETECPVTWEAFPGGHSPYPVYYKDMKKRVLDFFDAHPLDPYPREVVHVLYNNTATRAFWVDAKIPKLTDAKPWPEFKVRVRAGNVVEVLGASEEVKKLVFYLSDKLVDMGKPVKVIFGDRVLYSGKAEAKLEVKVHDGAFQDRDGVRPLWEELTEFYRTPQTAGAYDWVHFGMKTLFADPRHGVPAKRTIWLDLGIKEAGAPPKAVIDPKSKSFVRLDVMKPAAEADAAMSALARKLPVEVSVRTKMFSLQGVVDGEGKPSVLRPVGEGRSGEVILVKVRVSNKGRKGLTCLAELKRSVFMRYKEGIFPKQPEKGDAFRGIWEIAGTRQIRWQWLKHRNEAYQVFGFLMLNPGGLPAAKQLFLEGCQYNVGFHGVKRELALEPGATVELPLLLMSANPPDPKAKKPKYPDLAEIVRALWPQLMKELKD